VVILAAVYWREFQQGAAVQVEEQPVEVDRVLLFKSLAVSLAMVACFFAGIPVAKVAIVAGAVLLLISRSVHPRDVYNQVDWPLLVMFAGLFIVVAGVEKSSLEGALQAAAARARLDNGASLTGIAAVLSNLVSNVPAVLVFKPFLAHLSNPQLAWLRLAMASTLAGNLTILGSVANLIVVERARDKVVIGFWEYARAGVPVTVVTLLIGIWLLR